MGRFDEWFDDIRPVTVTPVSPAVIQPEETTEATPPAITDMDELVEVDIAAPQQPEETLFDEIGSTESAPVAALPGELATRDQDISLKPRFKGHSPLNSMVRQDWMKFIDLHPDNFDALLFRPDPEDVGEVVVEAGSARTAENILALLRKTIGSLPVVPLMMENPIELTMTDWLKSNQMPAGFTIGSDAVLKAILEDGGALRVSKQDLFSDEISTHLEAGKLATAAGLHWRDRMSFRLMDDMTIKAINFADELRDQNDDIDREDAHSRLVADFILFSGEFNAMMSDLTVALGGVCER